MDENIDSLPEDQADEKDLLTEPEGAQTDGVISDGDLDGLDETVAEDAGSALRLKARDYAQSQVGVMESPANSNCQPYSKYFGVGCDFWCGYFVSWAFDRAGNKDHRVPWPAGSSKGIYDWGMAHKMLASVPASGDIMIFADFSHCAIVRGVDQQGGAVITVDGNWSNGVRDVSGRNFRHQHYYFVRVNLASV
jgi:hypothetical protein